MEEVSSYHLLSSGLNVIRDPLDKKSIIAIIEFTPFSQLNPSEKDDLNFVSTFLHQTKAQSVLHLEFGVVQCGH